MYRASRLTINNLVLPLTIEFLTVNTIPSTILSLIDQPLLINPPNRLNNNTFVIRISSTNKPVITNIKHSPIPLIHLSHTVNKLPRTNTLPLSNTLKLQTMLISTRKKKRIIPNKPMITR